MTPADALSIEHECSQSLHYKGSRSTWEGDDELTVHRFLCGCGFALNMEMRKPVDPPDGRIP